MHIQDYYAYTISYANDQGGKNYGKGNFRGAGTAKKSAKNAPVHPCRRIGGCDGCDEQSVAIVLMIRHGGFTVSEPCTFVLGGSKISDAFMMMETVLSSGVADQVLTGGLVGQILLAGQGEPIGSGSLGFIEKSGYSEYIEKGKAIMDRYADRITLPVDMAQLADKKREEANIGAIPADFNAMDIGHETAALYREVILNSKTVFANGPVGVFEIEETEYGTKVLFEVMAETRGNTVVGGGDSVTAAKKYNVTDKIGYICTGGGALIRFLTGEELPVVKALRHAAKVHK